MTALDELLKEADSFEAIAPALLMKRLIAIVKRQRQSLKIIGEYQYVQPCGCCSSLAKGQEHCEARNCLADCERLAKGEAKKSDPRKTSTF